MFEEGARLKAERGPDNVHDFTLGNPALEPPQELLDAMRDWTAQPQPRSHAYMQNAGYLHVRQAIAQRLSESTGLPFDPEDVFMTVGSSGATNVFLKSILDPGDEVIVLMPCFSEYPFYVQNHSGCVVPVETDDEFLPVPARIAAAITSRTKALILNTPNNPTGRVYPAELLAEIDYVLRRSKHPITVISDEPYDRIVFDGLQPPPVASFVTRTVIANSWSKSFAIPGERIGYLALSPRLEEREELRAACTFANRILGFINAPAIWQWVIGQILDAPVDVAHYQQSRDLLCAGLSRIGYQVAKPEGTFYVFPRTPIPDDLAFVRMLAAEGVLAVPGAGFGRAGHMRFSLTVPRATIERALPILDRVFSSCLCLVG